MIQVQVVKLKNGVLVEDELSTINVNKFTAEECKEVSYTLGDMTFETNTVIQFIYNNWTILFIKQLHVK